MAKFVKFFNFTSKSIVCFASYRTGCRFGRRKTKQNKTWVICYQMWKIAIFDRRAAVVPIGIANSNKHAFVSQLISNTFTWKSHDLLCQLNDLQNSHFFFTFSNWEFNSEANHFCLLNVWNRNGTTKRTCSLLNCYAANIVNTIFEGCCHFSLVNCSAPPIYSRTNSISVDDFEFYLEKIACFVFFSLSKKNFKVDNNNATARKHGPR